MVEEDIIYMAVRECYVLLGQHAANVMVMFISLLISFVILIIVVWYYARRTSRLMQQIDLYKEKILGMMAESKPRRINLKKSKKKSKS